MLSVTNDGQLRSARMRPTAMNHVSSVSFSVPSRFSVLGEVVLQGTVYTVVGISRKSCQRARR